MRPFRFILAVLTALAWIVSSNCCLLATEFGPELDACCEHDSPDPDSRQAPPCGIGECGKCLTFDSGINLSVLNPLVAPAPDWTEDMALSRLIGDLILLSVRDVPLEPPDPGVPPSRWCDVVTKALPVRGPSLVA